MLEYCKMHLQTSEEYDFWEVPLSFMKQMVNTWKHICLIRIEKRACKEDFIHSMISGSDFSRATQLVQQQNYQWSLLIPNAHLTENMAP